MKRGGFPKMRKPRSLNSVFCMPGSGFLLLRFYRQKSRMFVSALSGGSSQD